MLERTLGFVGSATLNLGVGIRGDQVVIGPFIMDAEQAIRAARLVDVAVEIIQAKATRADPLPFGMAWHGNLDAPPRPPVEMIDPDDIPAAADEKADMERFFFGRNSATCE